MWRMIFQEKTTHFQDCWDLEFDDRIVPNNPRRYWKQYITSSVARFRCTMCGRSWPSNKVTVVFHMHLMYGRGTVKVRRFRQNCKVCDDEAPMEEPKFFWKNISTILENLVKKIRIKCYNEDLGRYERPYIHVPVKSRHEPDHCEGCQLGICARD